MCTCGGLIDCPDFPSLPREILALWTLCALADLSSIKRERARDCHKDLDNCNRRDISKIRVIKAKMIETELLFDFVIYPETGPCMPFLFPGSCPGQA